MSQFPMDYQSMDTYGLIAFSSRKPVQMSAAISGRGGMRLDPDAPEKHRQEAVIASSMRDRIRGQLLPTTVRDGKDIKVGQGVRKSF